MADTASAVEEQQQQDDKTQAQSVEFSKAAGSEAATGAAHFALVHGDIDPEQPTLVRVHVQDSLCDLTHGTRDHCGFPAGDALARIQQEGAGVLVILRHPESDDDLLRRVQDYQRQDAGERLPQPEASEDLRTYGAGAQILRDLGVRRMRVLGSPRRLLGLSGFDLEITEYVT